jgi:hypothetical protein
VQINREGKEIIFLIKNCFFANEFSCFVDKYQCKLFGIYFSKGDTGSRAKKGPPFSRIHVTFNYIMEITYELTKKE